MAAAESNDSWMELQRMREERMRFEVLNVLYRAVEGEVDVQRNVRPFAVDLGVWHAELFRIVEWLERQGLIRYCGAGPVVCLTDKGVGFISRGGERRSIRDSDVRKER